MSGQRHEAEVSGPSNRIGLSGANKTMLHLLKKAKVQLIKIDQQKQLKLSQVSYKERGLDFTNQTFNICCFVTSEFMLFSYLFIKHFFSYSF